MSPRDGVSGSFLIPRDGVKGSFLTPGDGGKGSFFGELLPPEGLERW